jgi:UPF0716 family protein affecting phage T7 exclusion
MPESIITVAREPTAETIDGRMSIVAGAPRLLHGFLTLIL